VSPEDVGRVRATAASATADPAFAAAFYDNLFSRAPAVEAMFAGVSLEDQRRKFSDQLAVVLRSLDDFESFRREAGALGVRHAGYGVEAHHYALLTEALLDALRQTLGDAVDDDVERAWRGALDLVAEEMQAAAEEG
jgi:hemoglobin-like flavoprotein